MKPEPVRCAVCQNFTLKGQTRAALGMFNCKLMPKWEFVSPTRPRECAAFNQVPADQLAARLKWEQTA